MTKIEVKATPEWLAQQVVTADGSGNTQLLDNEGGLVARTGQSASIVRAWLVEQIEAGYHAGVEAGRAAHRGEMEEGLRNAVPPAEKCLAAAKSDGLIADWQKSGEMSFLVSLGYGPDLDVLAREVSVVLKAIGKARRYEVRARQEVVEQARAEAANIAATVCHNELRGVLGLAYGWEECLATVRDLVAKDKAKPAPTDAAAEDAAIDGLVGEAIRDQGRECNAYTRTGGQCFYVGGTDADVRPDKARIWLKGWLLAAWARGVAYGQHPDAPPVLAESFGMAAREQVAAERAVDAAAVAPSEEALARARTDGVVEAFRKVAEWCQTSVMDGIDLDASIVEEVAKDAIGTLQHAAGAGDEKAREEGRRLGWKEAIAAVMRAHDAERRDVKRATDVAREMRKEADHAEDTRSRLALRAVATGNVLDAVIAAAPKEAP